MLILGFMFIGGGFVDKLSIQVKGFKLPVGRQFFWLDFYYNSKQ